MKKINPEAVISTPGYIVGLLRGDAAVSCEPPITFKSYREMAEAPIGQDEFSNLTGWGARATALEHYSRVAKVRAGEDADSRVTVGVCITPDFITHPKERFRRRLFVNSVKLGNLVGINNFEIIEGTTGPIVEFMEGYTEWGGTYASYVRQLHGEVVPDLYLDDYKI